MGAGSAAGESVRESAACRKCIPPRAHEGTCLRGRRSGRHCRSKIRSASYRGFVLHSNRRFLRSSRASYASKIVAGLPMSVTNMEKHAVAREAIHRHRARGHAVSAYDTHGDSSTYHWGKRRERGWDEEESPARRVRVRQRDAYDC